MGFFNTDGMGNGLLGAGINMIGSMFAQLQLRKLMAELFRYQQELQKQQNDFNVDMWNMLNEYNSASSQVERYRDAGLNVGMMMSGQGAGLALQLTSADPNTPTAPLALGNYDLASTFIQGLNLDLLKKQLEIANKKADAEIDLLNKLSYYQGVYNKYYELYGDDKMINEIDKVSEEINYLKALVKSLDYVNYRNYLAAISEVFNRNLSWEELKIRAAESKAQIERWQHQNKLDDASAKQLYTLVSYYQALTTGVEIENGIKAIEFTYAGEHWQATVTGERNNANLLFWNSKLGKNNAIKAYYDAKTGKIMFELLNDTKGFDKFNHYFTGTCNMISGAFNTVSDVAGGVMDLYTFGATANLKKSMPGYQNSKTNLNNARWFKIDHGLPMPSNYSNMNPDDFMFGY